MDPRVKLANKMLKAGNLHAASQVLDQALKSDPNDLEALHLYATTLYKRGKDAEAEGLFRRLAAMKPNDPIAHFSLGTTLVRLNRTEEARKSFEQALIADPNFQQARISLTKLSGPGKQTPAPHKEGLTPEELLHLTAGDLVAEGTRRLSSFLGRFLLALVIAIAGYAIVTTQEPGQLRWLAEGPPLQFPSISFLEERFEATGQEIHRQELEEALARVETTSAVLDRIVLVTGIAVLALGIGLFILPFLAAPSTHYEVYERRIDIRKGVLNRRRFSAWLYEILDVELRQTPFLTLTRNAEVRIYLPPSGQPKRSRFGVDRSILRIIGFGSYKNQVGLWQEVRDAGLRERKIMRKWYL